MSMNQTIIEKDRLVRGNKFLGRIDLRFRYPRTGYEAAIYASPPKGRRVLDIGCGNGLLLFNLKDRFEELTGLELIPEQAEWARRTLDGLAQKVDIRVGNIEDGTGFPDGHFDYIAMENTIEHIFDVRKVVREMIRLLQPGGRLCIVTPNIAYLKRRLRLIAGRFPWTSNAKCLIEDNELVDGGHIHYFTLSDLRFLVSGHGLVRSFGFGGVLKIIGKNIWPGLLASGACVTVDKAAGTSAGNSQP